MRAFMMTTAAVVGVSLLGMASPAHAGGRGMGYGHGGYNQAYGGHHHYRGSAYRGGYGGYRPAYVAPVYPAPVYGYPATVPVYGGYPYYGGYQGASFGISTPGFGLYIR